MLARTDPAPQLHLRISVLDGLARADALQRCAGLHYRAGSPRACVRVLGAFAVGGPIEAPALAGILCVSHATLNAPWRAIAWPELFAAPRSPADNARDVNTYVRTIARVIVLPAFRGAGVASTLVRAYLDHPMTPLTETLASFGRFAPLFERAGMRRITMPPSRRDLHFARALRAADSAPWRVIEARCARIALARHPHLARSAKAWLNASKATRAAADQYQHDPVGLLMLAAAGSCARPAAFVAP